MQISNDEYNQYKPLLFSLSYRLLGSVTEAEDIVHEVFLKAYEVNGANIENKKAYLCKMATNHCLDVLKSARKKRELYVGPWNPEPLMIEKPNDNDPFELILRKEGLSIAYLRMMETLSPVERAVVLLRDIFDMPYTDVSDVVNKKIDNCRKLYSRAKEKVRKVENESLDYEHNRMIIEQFITALKNHNKEQLLQLISENVTLYSDGGGKVLAALQPIQSSKNVSAFLNGLHQKFANIYNHQISNINGQPGIIIFLNHKLHSTISFSIQDGLIQELYMTMNPDKLTYIY